MSVVFARDLEGQGAGHQSNATEVVGESGDLHQAKTYNWQMTFLAAQCN